MQSGKDLVQEVAKLRRSLDDAEGLSRDTKKEWAFLRSENIALEERVVSGINTKYTHDYLSTCQYQLCKKYYCDRFHGSIQHGCTFFCTVLLTSRPISMWCFLSWSPL